jgi:single-strand DNA-binding protein
VTSINRVIIAGNLTADPSAGTGGATVTNFSIAMNRKFKNREGQLQEETTFCDIEAWGKTGELVLQYLKKGRGVFVEGRLKNNRWETADGQKRQRTIVVADNVQFMGGGQRDEAPADAPASPARPVAVPADGDDQAIPF